jgi:hypothetical protein
MMVTDYTHTAGRGFKGITNYLKYIQGTLT